MKDTWLKVKTGSLIKLLKNVEHWASHLITLGLTFHIYSRTEKTTYFLMHFPAWLLHETKPGNMQLGKLYVLNVWVKVFGVIVVSLFPMNINVFSREWEEI